MDLTRHTDQEIASKSSRLLAKAPLPTDYFAAAIRSKDSGRLSEALNQFLRLDPKYAELVLSDLEKRKIDAARFKQVARDGNQWKLLAPTGTSSGDKYSIKVFGSVVSTERMSHVKAGNPASSVKRRRGSWEFLALKLP